MTKIEKVTDVYGRELEVNPKTKEIVIRRSQNEKWDSII
jgi:hypothetical protein